MTSNILRDILRNMLDANHAVFKKNVVLRERTMKKTKNANAYDTIKDLQRELFLTLSLNKGRN